MTELPAINTVWRTTDPRRPTRRYTVRQHLEPVELADGRTLEPEVRCLRVDTSGQREVKRKLRAFDPVDGTLLPVEPPGDETVTAADLEDAARG